MLELSIRPRPRQDLHMHTSWSAGGMFAPAQVAHLADSHNAREAAFPDHDILKGQQNAILAARELGVKCMTGIELTTRFKADADGWTRMLHILGYGFRLEDAYAHPELSMYLDSVQAATENYYRGICDATQREPFIITLKDGQSVSVSLSFEELLASQTEGVLSDHYLSTGVYNKIRAGLKKISISSGDVYEALLRQREGALGALFKKNPGMTVALSKEAKTAFFTPRDMRSMYRTTPEAIQMLLEIGAVPVIAHPFNPHIGVRGKKELLEVINMGLLGIEAFSPSNVDKKIYDKKIRRQLLQRATNELISVAIMKGLLITGGSDFHNLEFTYDSIGYISKGFPIRCDHIDDILARRP